MASPIPFQQSAVTNGRATRPDELPCKPDHQLERLPAALKSASNSALGPTPALALESAAPDSSPTEQQCDRNHDLADCENEPEAIQWLSSRAKDHEAQPAQDIIVPDENTPDTGANHRQPQQHVFPSFIAAEATACDSLDSHNCGSEAVRSTQSQQPQQQQQPQEQPHEQREEQQDEQQQWKQRQQQQHERQKDPPSPPPASEATSSPSSATSPPYWTLAHQGQARPISALSVESMLPAITLRDNERDEGDEDEATSASTPAAAAAVALGAGTWERDRQRACWARNVQVVDPVLVNGSRTNLGAFVVWDIRVQTLNGSYMNIRKRYSEFDELRQRLIQTFPSFEAAVPDLPPKSIMLKFFPRFLEKRRIGLQYFLNCILLNPEFSGSPVLKDFLFQ